MSRFLNHFADDVCAFQWRYADLSPLIFKQWREDHEKSAFPSVYRFMFPDNQNNGNDAGHAIVLDGPPSTMESWAEIKDPVAVNLQTKSNGVQTIKTTTFTHPQEELKNGIIPASCQEIGETVTEPPKTFVNRDGVQSDDDGAGNRHQELLILECQEQFDENNVQEVKTIKSSLCSIEEEESKAPEAKKNEIAISSSGIVIAGKEQEPVVMIVAEEQQQRKRSVGNKVITPAIELRIEEYDSDEDVEEEIMPDGGLIRSVEGEHKIDAETAICIDHDASDDDDDDYNNNKIIHVHEENDDDVAKPAALEVKEPLLINEIAITADVHRVDQDRLEDVLLRDNQSAVATIEESQKERQSKEALEMEIIEEISHDGGNEAKVIGGVAEGENLRGRDETPTSESTSEGTVKSINSTKDCADVDDNVDNTTVKRPPGEARGECDINATKRTVIERESCPTAPAPLVGGENRNMNVQIRRKQYDVISSFDDYITSSSSLDDLDTVSSFGESSCSVVSGSERMSAVEEEEMVEDQEVDDGAEFWIKALQDGQKELVS